MIDIYKKHLVVVGFPQGTDLTVKAGDGVMQVLCKVSLDELDGMLFWIQYQKDEIIRQEKKNAEIENCKKET